MKKRRKFWYMSDEKKTERYGPSMKPSRVKHRKGPVEPPKDRSVADWYRGF